MLLAVDSLLAVWDAMVDIHQELGNIGLEMVLPLEVFMEITNGANLILLLHVITTSMEPYHHAKEMHQLQNAQKHVSMDKTIPHKKFMEANLTVFQAMSKLSKLKSKPMDQLKELSLFMKISQVTKVEFIHIPLDLN